jgi:hypothetical protein
MRLASVLAHVLASATLLACGGKLAPDEAEPSTNGGNAPGDVEGETGSTPSAGLDFGSGTPRPQPPSDAGVKDAATEPQDAEADGQASDGGCTDEPVFLRSDGCPGDIYYVPCGLPDGVDPSNGMTSAECAKVCGGARPYAMCHAYLNDDLPGPAFQCTSCSEGRRPQGYVDPHLEPTIAGWLAHAADLERVSIDAFQILRRELAHHGAPAELLTQAARAEADEVRHARILGALARRAGTTLESTPVAHGPVRTLLAIALENAVEGCVRETYGALLAGWQATHAEHIELRRAMKRIYVDETSHAELAWDVHAWLVTRLPASEVAEVTRAMGLALRELRAAVATPPPPPVARSLGLPLAGHARALVAGLEAHVFAPARAA